ncbi:MAG: hypothetical protein ACU836_03070 [Gammaproteobacteria bacterium]
MKNTQLARGVAFAIAGGTSALCGISNAAASATTMYNLTTSAGAENSTNTTDPTSGGIWLEAFRIGTDGFTNGSGHGNRPIGTIANQKWAGTGGQTDTPFGYSGAHLNWAVEFTGNSANKAEISTFDSFARYQVYADIDTAKGAWNDANTARSPSGWLHDTDTGLFRSEISGAVTLEIAGILQSGTNFGFTIFKGMDAVTTYAHHSAWNQYANETGISQFSTPYEQSDIMQGTILPISDIVAYSTGGSNLANLNHITFNAEAGQIYTIFVGGYRNGSWQTTTDGYRLSVSQVPIPGAAWLFGSTLLGLIGRQHRRKAISK